MTNENIFNLEEFSLLPEWLRILIPLINFIDFYKSDNGTDLYFNMDDSISNSVSIINMGDTLWLCIATYDDNDNIQLEQLVYIDNVLMNIFRVYFNQENMRQYKEFMFTILSVPHVDNFGQLCVLQQWKKDFIINIFPDIIIY